MEYNIFEKEFKALGTDIYLQIVANPSENTRVAADFSSADRIYREKEKTFSRFDAKSELSKLNSRLGEFHEAGSDIINLAKKSLDYYAKSQRIFDPRILNELERIGYSDDFSKKNSFRRDDAPRTANFKKDLGEELVIKGTQVKFLAKMDFSGIAKGYITDQVAGFLSARGWKNFLVDSGGDMCAKGQNKNGESWGISLEGAEDEDGITAEISDEGLATSGNTRRHWEVGGQKVHHLINPKDVGRFNFDLQSVTAIAATAEEADVMAKVLFLLGLEKGTAFAKKNKISAIFLKDNRETIKINL